MMYLKSCPKCRGDMYLEKDNYGTYRQCLQCGFIRDLDVPAPMVAQTQEVEVEPARRRGRKRKNAIAV